MTEIAGWGAIVQNWWPIAAAIVAVYTLHVYRRARLTEPPNEARGGFWREVYVWATIDARRTVGFVGGIIGGVILIGKVAGFSVLALGSLDPVVLADLVTVSLAALHLSGLELPPNYWAIIIGGSFALALYVGDFWRNERNR